MFLLFFLFVCLLHEFFLHLNRITAYELAELRAVMRPNNKNEVFSGSNNTTQEISNNGNDTHRANVCKRFLQLPSSQQVYDSRRVRASECARFRREK